MLFCLLPFLTVQFERSYTALTAPKIAEPAKWVPTETYKKELENFESFALLSQKPDLASVSRLTQK